MTDASTHPTPEPPAQTTIEQTFDRLNPSFGADHAARADDPPSLHTVEAGLSRGWGVTLSEHLENTGPSQWRQQHVADRAYYAAERAAWPARQTVQDAEDAFTRLNPDFAVLPDARHADQHAFAQRREAALALGTRAAMAAMDEAHPDPQQRQAAITARARSAARHTRGERLPQARHDRPQSPAATRRSERAQRRSRDRRPQAEREEERSR
ncbi:MAG TPA: hypothetical protein VFU54_15365 [Actinomycetota bacterium]|nr:hypothetical protein [Actinomycetota bacterium]